MSGGATPNSDLWDSFRPGNGGSLEVAERGGHGGHIVFKAGDLW